ncbi:MAG: ABC transporter substrate-binding protein, partial [Rhizobiales bacterium]|nr:ABC transporter substrate-binding protein [Hyphomicrobiales bacterium]
PATPFLAEPEAAPGRSASPSTGKASPPASRVSRSRGTQLFPPALGDWHDPEIAPLAYDPEAAKESLEKLGWTAGEDGILTRDGERFSLTLRTFPDRPEQPLVAAALQDQWRAIGVELEVSVTNYSEIPAGHQDGTLEVGLFARNYGLTPDPIGTVLSDFGPDGGDWGAMSWEAPAVADAVSEIAATTDPDTRAPLIQTVVTTLQSELPLIPIVWYQHTAAIAEGLQGIVVDPFERHYGLRHASWAEE